MSNMSPGKYYQSAFVVGDIKILPSICYEIAFPDLNFTQDSSIGLLLTITNDAWFGDSSAQAQHLQMAEMRALELKRPVIFVSNDGITALINANGIVEAAAPQHEIAVLKGKVQPMMGLTPWMKNGMDPILVIIICMFFAAFSASTQRVACCRKFTSKIKSIKIYSIKYLKGLLTL